MDSACIFHIMEIIGPRIYLNMLQFKSKCMLFLRKASSPIIENSQITNLSQSGIDLFCFLTDGDFQMGEILPGFIVYSQRQRKHIHIFMCLWPSVHV